LFVPTGAIDGWRPKFAPTILSSQELQITELLDAGPQTITRSKSVGNPLEPVQYFSGSCAARAVPVNGQYIGSSLPICCSPAQPGQYLNCDWMYNRQHVRPHSFRTTGSHPRLTLNLGLVNDYFPAGRSQQPPEQFRLCHWDPDYCGFERSFRRWSRVTKPISRHASDLRGLRPQMEHRSSRCLRFLLTAGRNPYRGSIAVGLHLPFSTNPCLSTGDTLHSLSRRISDS